MIDIKVTRLHDQAIIPKHNGVGYDLHALVLTEYNRPSKRVIGANSTMPINTGLKVEIPRTHFAFICPLRSLAQKSISVANSPGILIGASNEIIVLVYNGSYINHWVEHHARIAQLIIIPLTPSSWSEARAPEYNPPERPKALPR